MKIKKRIAIAVALVMSAAAVSVKLEKSALTGQRDLFAMTPEVLSQPENGMEPCKCSFVQGSSCAVDNLGTRCAPYGTEKCWEYNNNCHS